MLAVILVAAGCGGKKDYKEVIQDFYSASLNDPSSYELVEMSEPDSFKPRDLGLLALSYGVWLADESSQWGTELKTEDLKWLNSLAFRSDTSASILCYTVRHKYRARNGFGSIMMYNDIVYLDTLKDSVLYVMRVD